MKRAIAAVLLLCLFLLSACGPDYVGDERLGRYENGEGYVLLLREDGSGVLTYSSVYGTETEEEILFTFEKDGTLVLHGTAEVGGVIGRSEFYGHPEKTADQGYTLSLRAVDSGVTLATFTKISE